MEDYKLWIAAIYLRLSNEDRLKQDETLSFSILNQKEQIKQFVYSDGNIIIYDYYIDDGFSGTNFDRPDFQRMINDIKNKKVNTVIVKDLSRLGRNYIDTGDYLENIFPKYNIRFISLNEGIDSYKDPSSFRGLLVPFKNIVNDEYSRDISIKVKSALIAKRKNGEWVGSNTPYGYIKNPNDKHKLIIDKEQSENVDFIFQLYLGGMGSNTIASELNRLKIPSPSKCLDIKNNKLKDKNYLWSQSTVVGILKNQVYCGDVIQGKSININFKNHRRRLISKDGYVIVENIHEPIVSRDTFNKVQEMFKKKSHSVEKKLEHILSGYLKCFDCGSKMAYKKRSTIPKTEDDYYCYCRTYTENSKDACTSHRVIATDIYKLVLELLKKRIDNVLQLYESVNQVKDICNIELDNKIDNFEKKLNSYKFLKKELYENYKNNSVNKDEYLLSILEKDNKIKKIINELNNLNTEKSEYNRLLNYNNKSWIQEYKKNKDIDELTRDVVIDLINMVYVHDNGSVDVDFKYDKEYIDTVNLLNKIKEHNTL